VCQNVTIYTDNVRVKSFGFILVSGGRLFVGLTLPGAYEVATALVMAAAGFAAEVAVFG
jgi:hypothetical protein